ncbi:MAG TPA: hypothetical protein DEG70_09330 [Chloroflexi bacterium]|jgi:uncharacterized membrane protein|nr:hypothetical protein [Chloroflexota bacterium]HRA32399.1 DUF2231 domain-containing protein [Thermomicrobiales bacterium]
MRSRARLFGHPIHQQLIVFPLGLLATATLFDIINRIFGWTSLSAAAYYMIAAGIIAGLIAAVFGFIDWTAIPNGTRAKRVGLTHGASMFVAVVLFIIAWFLHDHSNPSALALVLQIVGSGIAVGGGWLGGELVDHLGIGVEPGANPDAAGSFDHEPAGDGGLAHG